MKSLSYEGSYSSRRDDRVEVIEFVVGAAVLLVKVRVDRILQDAERVVRPLMQAHAHFLEDVVGHIVEGVVRQHSCKTSADHDVTAQAKPQQNMSPQSLGYLIVHAAVTLCVDRQNVIN